MRQITNVKVIRLDVFNCLIYFIILIESINTCLYLQISSF